MAGIKISQLPNLNALCSDFLFVVVDTQSNSTKKTTLKEIVSFFDSSKEATDKNIDDLIKSLNELSIDTETTFRDLSTKYSSLETVSNIERGLDVVSTSINVVSSNTNSNFTDLSNSYYTKDAANEVFCSINDIDGISSEIINSISSGDALKNLSSLIIGSIGDSVSNSLEIATAASATAENALEIAESTEQSLYINSFYNFYQTTYSNSAVQKHLNPLYLLSGNLNYRIDENTFRNTTTESNLSNFGKFDPNAFNMIGVPIRTGQFYANENANELSLLLDIDILLDSYVSIYSNNRNLLSANENIDDLKTLVHCFVNYEEIPFSLEKNDSDTQHDFILKFSEKLNSNSKIQLVIGNDDILYSKDNNALSNLFTAISDGDASYSNDAQNNLIGMIVAVPTNQAYNPIYSAIYGFSLDLLSAIEENEDGNDSKVYGVSLKLRNDSYENDTTEEFSFLSDFSIPISGLSGIAEYAKDDEGDEDDETIPRSITIVRHLSGDSTDYLSLNGNVLIDVDEISANVISNDISYTLDYYSIDGYLSNDAIPTVFTSLTLNDISSNVVQLEQIDG